MQSIKLVFTNYRYVIVACIIFVAMFIPLLIIAEYIFLEPYLVAYVPFDSLFGFSLIVAVSALSGIVLTMNIYRVRILRNSSKKMGGGVFGSIIGSSAGACGCGPIGFAVISSLGSIGGTAAAFLTNYEIPIRLGAIAILGIAYYTTSKSICIECKIKSNPSEEK